MQVQGILEISLYVDDLEAAEEFYRRVLNLEVHSVQENRHVFLRCGPTMLLIFNPYESSTGDDVPTHGADGPSHVAFRITLESLEGWRRQLVQHGVAIEREIEWPGGGRSIYFRDPSGNSLELATPEVWNR